MGEKNEGMVFTVPADLFLEPSLLGKLDLVEDETRESLLGKETGIGIGMPEEGTESDSVLDRGSAIDLGPNVLSQCPPGPDVQALAAQAEAQNGKARPTIEERLKALVLVTAQELESEGPLPEMPKGGV